MTYSVTVSNPTGIPGYAPEYAVATVATWGEAYDFAVATAKAQGDPQRVSFDFDRFHTALRDGASEAVLEVYSRQPYTQLGRPFTPALLATIKVASR